MHHEKKEENAGSIEVAGKELDAKISELKNKVEAVLFAAGRAVGIEELSVLMKENSHQLIKEAVREVKKELESKDSSLLLTEENEGNAWKLTVRDKYVEMVKDVAPHTELDKALLGTLAIIAWKQPVMQADIVKIRSSVAYEHIAKLLELGFVSKEKTGRTFVIKVTNKFFEYFDLPDTEAVKKMFGPIAEAKEAEAKEQKLASAENVIVYEAKGISGEENKAQKEKTATEMETEHLGSLDIYPSEIKEEAKEAESGNKNNDEKKLKVNAKNKKSDDEDKPADEELSNSEDSGEKQDNASETEEPENESEESAEGIEASLADPLSAIAYGKDEKEDNKENKQGTEGETEEENEEENNQEPKKEKSGQESSLQLIQEPKKQKKEIKKDEKRKLSKELEDFAGEEAKLGEEKEEEF